MIKIPSQKTLDKYGLSAEEWREILRKQGDVCPVCKKQPTSGKWNTDHYHHPKFKKMSPEEKKMHVRGVLCWFCNKNYLSRAITIQKLKNAIEYLQQFEEKLKNGKTDGSSKSRD